MNNDIFKQIKDTLDNYEIEPSKEVWQNIDSRIQKATRIQALRRVVVATIAIATVAAANKLCKNTGKGVRTLVSLGAIVAGIYPLFGFVILALFSKFEKNRLKLKEV